MSDHIIRGCSLDSETGGLVFEYLTPAQDVRNNGMVVNHALLVPPEDHFLGLIEEVELTLQRCLTTALSLFEDADPLVPDEDLDGSSPYDNPEER